MNAIRVGKQLVRSGVNERIVEEIAASIPGGEDEGEPEDLIAFVARGRRGQRANSRPTEPRAEARATFGNPQTNRLCLNYGAIIAGTGSYVPEKRLTNDDLSKMVDTNDEWIVQRTGIRERRIAGHGESTATLGTARRPQGAGGRRARSQGHRPDRLRHDHAGDGLPVHRLLRRRGAGLDVDARV